MLQWERMKSWSRTNTAERGENGADIELAHIQRRLGELIEKDCWNVNIVSWRCGIAAQYPRTRAERYPPRVCSLHCNIIPEYTAVEVTLLRFGDNLTRSLSGVTILQQDCVTFSLGFAPLLLSLKNKREYKMRKFLRTQVKHHHQLALR